MASERKATGRPRKLTEELQSQVIAIVANGGSRCTAAKYVRVSQSTLYAELVRNPAFAKKLNKAIARCELHHLRNVNESSDWQSSAWFLARKWPDKWAEVRKVSGPEE